MNRRTVVGSVGAAALGVVGVSAYTSATVSRAASLTVENDNNAVLELTEGVGATLNNGKLQLNGNNNSINRAATFEFGNTSTPSGNPAFVLTNRDTQTHNVTISLTKNSAAHSLTIQTEKNTSGTTNEVTTGTDQTYALATDDSVNFAFTLDTGNSDENYDGDLTFTA